MADTPDTSPSQSGSQPPGTSVDERAGETPQASNAAPADTRSSRAELDQVLPHALRYVRGKRGGDLVAVLLVGSGARRRLTSHSDVDLIAVVKGQDEGQECVRVAGRIVEIKYRAQKLVEEELRQVPRLPPLLRKARVLFELDGAGSTLVERANQCFRQGLPPPTLTEKIRWKADCLHWLGKAEDLALDPATSQYLLTGCLDAWLTALFRLRGWWPTAPAETLRFIASREQGLADLFATAVSAASLADRLEATRRLVHITFEDIPNPPRVD